MNFDEPIERALTIAKDLAINGIPIFVAPPSTLNDIGFLLPNGWEKTRANKHVLDHWRPGDALCAVGGHLCDFVDIDPRNGGDLSWEHLCANGIPPRSYGTASTPSGGTHQVIAPLRLRKGKRDGIDYQGGDGDGRGRGFVFISPTVRPSKITGEMRMYQWINEPDLASLVFDGETDTSGGAFRQWITEKPKKSGNSQGGGGTVYTGKFHIDATHTGPIRPGQGHDAIIALCGYLLKKYPDISWTDYEELCRARWQEFDQSQFAWDWDECLYQITNCWDSFERGKPYDPNDPFSYGLPPSTNGSAPPPPPSGDFWTARPVLTHIRDFARARRVGPWALLGCVMVRVVAAAPPSLVLPPLIGGQASLNLFAGIVSVSGGGKGTAEAAAQDAIDLPHVPILGPGSGEGIGHLFFGWDKADKELKQHTTAVILSAAEIDTLSALKGRQASTLFPELRKAWMGEPLGFAYVDKEKRLTVPRHSYRLCLSVGIQPANAAPILDDHSAGTPQRLNWFPAGDPNAPDERPEEPQQLSNPLWTPASVLDNMEPTRQEMGVCETARAEIDAARLAQLRGITTEALDGHALLAQLKIAAALALLDGRRDAVSEDDWRLAGVVRVVSDQTRQHVADVLEQGKARSNRAQAHAEADRAIVVDSRMAEHGTERAGRAIMRKLDGAGWVTRSVLRKSLASKDRGYFDDAIEALKLSGQIEEREVQGGQTGTEYRKG
jgi:hypothetical protein